MSSSTVFAKGFGYTAQNPAWQEDTDGAMFTTVAKMTDSKTVTWDLRDFLAAGDVISSVAYADQGVTTSDTSNTATTLTFTVTGVGETEVTVTLDSGRQATQRWRVYVAGPKRRTDYGR